MIRIGYKIDMLKGVLSSLGINDGAPGMRRACGTLTGWCLSGCSVPKRGQIGEGPIVHLNPMGPGLFLPLKPWGSFSPADFDCKLRIT